MATIDKKQTRWYAKSTFDSLDKTTIPVGTEIQVTGEIEETDLTADLKTKINGKLTAPTTPTVDSVVTMLADGTTGTKALSEFSGKLYEHYIEMTSYNLSTQESIYLFIYFINSDDSSYTTYNTIYNALYGKRRAVSIVNMSSGGSFYGTAQASFTESNLYVRGTLVNNSSGDIVGKNFDIEPSNFESITDTVTEL